MKKKISIILTGLFIGCSALLSAQCNGGHTTNPGDMWLSCDGDTNPNPDRTQQHWILYDFSVPYILHESHLWNYNVPGATENGVFDVAFDISMNGTDWTAVTVASLPQASGEDDYQGFTGPDFGGIEAQYLLISIDNNHGGDCYGFSEIKIDVDPGSVSVDEPNVSALEFGLYPNPTRDQFTIQLESFNETEIRLLSISGAVIQVTRPESPTTRMQVGDLPAGIYLIQVINDAGQSGVKRLAVTR